MASVDKPAVLSDWLKWESAPKKMFSREKVTVVSGQNLKNGAVVGKVTASGKLKAYDNGASDGSEGAYGVLFADVDATAADKAGVVIVRDAIVAKSKLVFDAGQNQAAKDAAYVDLAAKNSEIGPDDRLEPWEALYRQLEADSARLVAANDPRIDVEL